MNTVLLDVCTAAGSLIILMAALMILPQILPAGIASLAAIVIFIITMSAGGYYISEKCT